MQRKNLIITYKPDVLSMVEHDSGTNNYKGLTARSEVESIHNVKSVDAAKKVLLKRNISNIIVAKYMDEPIFITPSKKQRKKFVKKQKSKKVGYDDDGFLHCFKNGKWECTEYWEKQADFWKKKYEELLK